MTDTLISVYDELEDILHEDVLLYADRDELAERVEDTDTFRNEVAQLMARRDARNQRLVKCINQLNDNDLSEIFLGHDREIYNLLFQARMCSSELAERIENLWF